MFYTIVGNNISVHSGAAFPPKNFSILVGALIFFNTSDGSTSKSVSFCFPFSQNRLQFSSVLIFLSVATVCFAKPGGTESSGRRVALFSPCSHFYAKKYNIYF